LNYFFDVFEALLLFFFVDLVGFFSGVFFEDLLFVLFQVLAEIISIQSCNVKSVASFHHFAIL